MKNSSDIRRLRGDIIADVDTLADELESAWERIEELETTIEELETTIDALKGKLMS